MEDEMKLQGLNVDVQTGQDSTPDELGRFSEIRLETTNGYYGPSILPVVRLLQGTTAQTSGNYNTPFFIALRPFEIIAIKERHRVASTSGTLDVLIVKDGKAFGTGTTVLSGTVDLSATADTVQDATLTPIPENRILSLNDALVLNSGGTLTNQDGVCVTILLKAI